LCDGGGLYHRSRHYGLLANAGRREHLAKARELLHVVPAAAEPQPSTDAANAPAFACPHCGAAMIIIETFAHGQPIRAPPTLRAAAGLPAAVTATVRPLFVGYYR
jgi:hypothetical protein